MLSSTSRVRSVGYYLISGYMYVDKPGVVVYVTSVHVGMRFHLSSKTTTKVITLANHSRDKQHDEPIRTRAHHASIALQCVSQLLLVLVLLVLVLLIGLESEAIIFRDLLQTQAKQNQYKRQIVCTLNVKLYNSVKRTTASANSSSELVKFRRLCSLRFVLK